MPTKKELQQKINDLEKLVNVKEGNFNDFVGFIKTLNLWDIFVKTMKTDKLELDEVKQNDAMEYDIQWYKCDKCNKYKFDGYENCMATKYGEICVECYKEHYENK